MSLPNAPEPIPSLIEHEGFTIEVTKAYRFVIVGEDARDEIGGSGAYGFDSLKEAKEAIDKALSRRKKQKRTRETMAVPVLDANGEPTTWRGLDGRNGKVLIGTPDYTGYIYPDHAPLAALLQERKRLAERVRVIDKTVKPYQINHAYASRIEADAYDEKVGLMRKEAESLLERAKKNFPTS